MTNFSWNRLSPSTNNVNTIIEQASLDKLHSVERVYKQKDLRVVASQGKVMLASPKGEADFSYHAFSQFCTEAGAPTSFLAKLTPETAAKALHEARVRELDPEQERKLLVRTNGGERPVVKASTSTDYSRLYDIDLIKRAQAEGMTIQRISRSERAFSMHVVTSSIEVEQGIRIGQSWVNSEVYFMSVRANIEAFVLACLNGLMSMRHIFSSSRRHVGDLDSWVGNMFLDGADVMSNNGSVPLLRAMLQASAGNALGLWLQPEKWVPQTSRLLGLPQQTLEASLLFAEKYNRNPHLPQVTALHLAQGLTEYAQTVEQTETMLQIEAAAGKLLDASVAQAVA